MKKIGIMTYHFADNYGAVLQTYSLRQAISSIPEMEASIVSYIPSAYVSPRYWKDTQTYVKKRTLFWNFLKEKCGLGEQICSIVDGKEYDVICVGSDQVWNRKCINTEEYFLPNVSDSVRKISYAASLGLPLKDLLSEKELFKKYLPAFNSVSIREEEHKFFVEEIIGRECKVVLDPTLLVEHVELEKIVAKDECAGEEFVLLFWTGERNYQAIEMANTLSRIYGYTVKHTFVEIPSYMFAKDGGCVYFEGVETLLWYVKNAKMVITDSYHGMCMSIQFRRDFFVFANAKRYTRFQTVLDKFDLHDRVVTGYVRNSKFNEHIDYDDVENKLLVERRTSMDYLRHALECKSNDANNG